MTPQSNIVEHFFGTSDSIGFSTIKPEVDIFRPCFLILSLESRPFRVERGVYRLFLKISGHMFFSNSLLEWYWFNIFKFILCLTIQFQPLISSLNDEEVSGSQITHFYQNWGFFGIFLVSTTSHSLGIIFSRSKKDEECDKKYIWRVASDRCMSWL